MLEGWEVVELNVDSDQYGYHCRAERRTVQPTQMNKRNGEYKGRQIYGRFQGEQGVISSLMYHWVQ